MILIDADELANAMHMVITDNPEIFGGERK